MMLVKDVLAWLRIILGDSFIAIGEGGLTLETTCDLHHQHYLEVGGWPNFTEERRES